MTGDELKSFRLMMGYSQLELGSLIGYSRRRIVHMEQGVCEIRPGVDLACAALLIGVLMYDGGGSVLVNAHERKNKGTKR